MTRVMCLFPAAMRRVLTVLSPLIVCGYAGAAEDDCFPSFPGGFPESFLSKPNVAVVMRIDGGLDFPRNYVNRVTKDSERPWTDEFRNDLRESFRGENRFDNFSEFLVLKTIKGDLDPVIVFFERQGAANNTNALGKLILIAFEDIQSDGAYNFSYHQVFPLTMNSNSYTDSNEFQLPLDCEWMPFVKY